MYAQLLRLCVLAPILLARVLGLKFNVASFEYARGDLGVLKGVVGVDREFDYVVVGGGTAGNVVGFRLAEAGYSVAIVESGSFNEIPRLSPISIPRLDLLSAGFGAGGENPALDWQFKSEPSAGTNNRRLFLPQGKTIGGSSMLNFMVHHRSSKGAFDKWAELVGDDSYRLENLMEHFEKSTTVSPPNQGKRLGNASTPFDATDFASSGKSGPVQVGYPNWVSPSTTVLERALDGLGLRPTREFNRGKLLGYHYAQSTIRSSDQTRSSSLQYIYDAMAKKLGNLKVFTEAHATRILFDGNRRATGVEMVSHGLTRTLTAKREVLVAAGVFQSPQLLMVSGIGPPETLGRFDIPVVSALAGVGQNLEDHVFIQSVKKVSIPTIARTASDVAAMGQAMAQYMSTNDGPLASNNIELLGWEKLPEAYRGSLSRQTEADLSAFPDDWPEVEILSAEVLADLPNGRLASSPLNDYLALAACLTATLSRGNITITSASALDKPLVNPSWLTAKADQDVAVASLRRLRDIRATPELQAIAVGEEVIPGEHAKTDKELLEAIRDMVYSGFHPSCTCRMGKRDDAMAVVDAQARVHGVKGLRVVDASAFALLPPGHPQSIVYALAEKIADDIIKGGREPSRDEL